MSLLDGVGHIGWWGLTPSQDLTTYCTHNKGDTPLRILCVGANDLRHILEMVGDFYSILPVSEWILTHALKYVEK